MDAGTQFIQQMTNIEEDIRSLEILIRQGRVEKKQPMFTFLLRL